MRELFLQLDGFSIRSASDGVAALECVAQNKPCLILLDVNMPRMDGISFGRTLRRQADPEIARTPVVLLTALADTKAAVKRQAVQVITQPVSLMPKMESQIRHRRLHRGRRVGLFRLACQRDLEIA